MEAMPPHQDNVKEMQLERLRRFVERGLRIEDHSFIREHIHRLPHWAHGRVNLTMHEDGTFTMEIDRPQPEAMESMAGRIRPLILQTETANLSNVLEAIGYLVRDLPDDDELKRIHEVVSRDWKARRPVRGRRLAYDVMATGREAITDTDLALAWLYADYVHQDIETHRVALTYSYEDRYQAAVLVLCNVAYHARVALNLTRKLANRKIIDLQIPQQPPLPPASA